MRNYVKLAGGLIAAAIILACTNGGSDAFGNDPPVAFGFYPCTAKAGDQVTVYGSNMNGPGTSITVDGVNCPIVSQTGTQIVFTMGAAAADGAVHISNTYGSDDSPTAIHVNGQTIAESEPNDNIDGSNATQMQMNFRATGSLANVADKDHFLFDCVPNSRPLKLKITPRVVGTVYVNGSGVSVDANGYAHFTKPFSNQDVLIGLTGGTGNYTLELSLE